MGTLRSEFNKIQSQIQKPLVQKIITAKRLVEAPVTRIKGKGVNTNDLKGPCTLLVKTDYNLDALSMVGKTESYRIKESVLRNKMIVVVVAENGSGYIQGMIDHNNCWPDEDGKVSVVFKNAKLVRPIGGVYFDSVKRVQV